MKHLPLNMTRIPISQIAIPGETKECLLELACDPKDKWSENPDTHQAIMINNFDLLKQA